MSFSLCGLGRDFLLAMTRVKPWVGCCFFVLQSAAALKGDGNFNYGPDAIGFVLYMLLAQIDTAELSAVCRVFLLMRIGKCHA